MVLSLLLHLLILLEGLTPGWRYCFFQNQL